MNDLINWLRAQPSALLVCLGGLLIVTVLISWTLLGYKKYSRWWLGSSVLPLVGWRLVCALGVLPGRQRSAEEVVPEQAAGRHWGGLAIMFLVLSMFTGCSWMSLKKPQLPGLNEGQVRSMILNVVESMYSSQGIEEFVPVEIDKVEELDYDEASGRRRGRAIVKHNLGRDTFFVTLTFDDPRYLRFQVEVEIDKSEMLAANSWRTRQRLLEELAELPVVRELGLSTDQLTSLSFVESPSDPGSMERRGEVHLPAGAGKPAVVLKFLVHWCDLAQTCPGIQWFDGELPTLESAAFQHELKHAVEDWPQFRENSDTYGTPVCERVEPLIFDAEQQQRFYRVHVRHARGETQLSVVNRWKNREGGFWEVKVLEP